MWNKKQYPVLSLLEILEILDKARRQKNKLIGSKMEETRMPLSACNMVLYRGNQMSQSLPQILLELITSLFMILIAINSSLIHYY